MLSWAEPGLAVLSWAGFSWVELGRAGPGEPQCPGPVPAAPRTEQMAQPSWGCGYCEEMGTTAFTSDVDEDQYAG